MATTYGYGGEFSSDDDMDKMEQQHKEGMVQAKFDHNLRPSLRQIEDTIEAIKSMPFDQEVNLSDDMLAGLLDYFKTQRGPIVDSTRRLYNKIALKLIRGDPQSLLAQADNVVTNDTNGNSDNKVIGENNNSIEFIQKAPRQRADTFSSDEDEDLPPTNRRQGFAQADNDENKMEVDSVTPAGPARDTKQVDMSTTDEEEDDEDGASKFSEDDTSELEELNSESDVMDVTPIKPPASQKRGAAAVEKEKQAMIAASRVTPKQPESSVKRQPLAQSTPKESKDTAKKPYTRSQRVATRSATRSKAPNDSAKSLAQANVSGDVFIENRRTSNRKYALLSVTLLVVVMAVLFYYFRSSVSGPASRFQVKF